MLTEREKELFVYYLKYHLVYVLNMQGTDTNCCEYIHFICFILRSNPHKINK